MELKSSAFESGAPIPAQFTCDGEDVSPPFEWDGVPGEARSFVLLCTDPDAPRGTWHHWAAYNIPAQVRGLGVGAARTSERYGFKQATNDFGRQGYGGPCPPPGHGRHHYHFRLLALAVMNIPVAGTSGCRDVEREARKHLIAETHLVGVYER